MNATAEFYMMIEKMNEILKDHENRIKTLENPEIDDKFREYDIKTTTVKGQEIKEYVKS